MKKDEKKEPQTPLGFNLLALMERWGVNQAELQELFDLKKSIISNYIYGRSGPKVATLVKLESLTGIPMYAWLKERIPESLIPSQPLTEYSVLATLNELGERAKKPLVDLTGLNTELNAMNTKLEALAREVEELKRGTNCQ